MLYCFIFLFSFQINLKFNFYIFKKNNALNFPLEKIIILIIENKAIINSFKMNNKF